MASSFRPPQPAALVEVTIVDIEGTMMRGDYLIEVMPPTGATAGATSSPLQIRHSLPALLVGKLALNVVYKFRIPAHVLAGGGAAATPAQNHDYNNNKFTMSVRLQRIADDHIEEFRTLPSFDLPHEIGTESAQLRPSNLINMDALLTPRHCPWRAACFLDICQQFVQVNIRVDSQLLNGNLRTEPPQQPQVQPHAFFVAASQQSAIQNRQQQLSQQAPPQELTQQAPPQQLTQQAPPQQLTQQAPPQQLTQQTPPQQPTQQAPPQQLPQQVVRPSLTRTFAITREPVDVGGNGQQPYPPRSDVRPSATTPPQRTAPTMFRAAAVGGGNNSQQMPVQQQQQALIYPRHGQRRVPFRELFNIKNKENCRPNGSRNNVDY